jgi:hypothetical protein
MADPIEDAWHWLQTTLKGRPVPALVVAFGLPDGSLLAALDRRAPDGARPAFPADPENHVLVAPTLAQQGGATAVGAAKTLKRIVFGARANAEARRQLAPRYLANVLRNATGVRRAWLARIATLLPPGGCALLTVDLVPPGDKLWPFAAGQVVEACHGSLRHLLDDLRAARLVPKATTPFRALPGTRVDIALVEAHKPAVAAGIES